MWGWYDNDGVELLKLPVMAPTWLRSHIWAWGHHAIERGHQLACFIPMVYVQCQTHTRGAWRAIYVDPVFARSNGEGSGDYGDPYRLQSTIQEGINATDEWILRSRAIPMYMHMRRVVLAITTY